MLPLLARSSCARTGLILSPLVRARCVPLSPSLASVSSRRTTSSASSSPSTLTSTVAASTTPSAPTLLDKVLPSWAAKAKPYLLLTRIDKPIGSILLYWPCAWSITMASTALALPPSIPLWYMSLFAVGAVIMRGAGCTVNDMWDKGIDRAVERTKTRPLAQGDVTQAGALAFLGGQLALGLGVLTQLNMYSIALGASSVSLVAIYPLMKRITYYPQVFLGLVFNWGALLGWSAVAGTVDWAVAGPMYIGGAMWCVMYDTIYAHQDKKDDILVGVKSTALKYGESSRTFISTLSAGVVSLLTLTGAMAGAGPIYYAVSCAGAAAHLAWQCKTVNFDDRADCWRKFASNGYLGGLIWLGMAGDYIQQVILPMIG